MISKVTHKRCVDLTTLVSQAKNLDEKNGNTLWMNAASRQMENLKVVFYMLEDRAKNQLVETKPLFTCSLTFARCLSVKLDV